MAAQILAGEAQRREGFLNQGQNLLSHGVLQQLLNPALLGQLGLAQNITDQPYLGYSEERQRGVENMARRRIASAGEAARTAMGDVTSASGMAGGESGAAVAGTDFRAAAELADDLTKISEQFGVGRAQERGMNVQNLMGLGQSTMEQQLGPQALLSNAVANRQNPELQGLANMLGQLGMSTGTAALGGSPSTSGSFITGGANLLGSILSAMIMAPASSERFKEGIKPATTTGREALRYIKRASESLKDWNYKGMSERIPNALVIEEAPRYGHAKTFLNVPTAIGDLMKAVAHLDKKLLASIPLRSA
jgi:hypothetical protein